MSLELIAHFYLAFAAFISVNCYFKFYFDLKIISYAEKWNFKLHDNT